MFPAGLRPPSQPLHQFLCLIQVRATDHVAPEGLPDPPQVFQCLPAELQQVGVAVGTLSGPGVHEQPVLVLSLPKRRRRGRASPPLIAAGLDGWCVLLQVALSGVVVGAARAPAGDVIGEWPTAAIWAEITERRTSGRALTCGIHRVRRSGRKDARAGRRQRAPRMALSPPRIPPAGPAREDSRAIGRSSGTPGGTDPARRFRRKARTWVWGPHRSGAIPSRWRRKSPKGGKSPRS
jgi:hypothetical protein